MKIKINNYEIKGQKGDWIVTDKSPTINKKTGEATFKNDKDYFATLCQALCFVMNSKIGEYDKLMARELISVIHKEALEIKEIADKLEKHALGL